MTRHRRSGFLMPRSPRSATPRSPPRKIASPPGWWCVGSTTPATATPCSRCGAITRSSPTTDLPTAQADNHPPSTRHHRNRLRRVHRRPLGAHALRKVSGRTRRGCCARPSRTICCAPPASCWRCPRGGPRRDAAPQNRHHPSPTGPPTTPTDSASTHALALDRTVAHIVANTIGYSPPASATV